MTTSLTTFERAIRDRYLDALIGQCGRLGSTLANIGLGQATEVIDPEALFWSCLWFQDTEPRLAEAVAGLLDVYGSDILHHRVRGLLASDEPRAARWKELTHVVRPTHPNPKPPGRPSLGPTTALLRARHVLGGDVRHFLLVYLLANEGGASLRRIADWSGYGYRVMIRVAQKWEEERVITIDRGNCRLTDSESRRSILQLGAERLPLVNWFQAFAACEALIGFLRSAWEKALLPESPVVRSHVSDAQRALVSALPTNNTRSPTIGGLLQTIAEFEDAITPAITAP